MTFPDYWPLAKLNSITKYPSIPSFHRMGERGRLTDEVPVNFEPTEDWEATEKIDGTNARIILTAHGAFIGSREELLTFESDVVRNPALGIVETLLPVLLASPQEGPHGDQGDVIVLWGEVYGGNIGKAAQRYSASGQTSFRLFDVAQFDARDWQSAIGMSLEDLARWRDRGGQPFLSSVGRAAWAEALGVQEAPLACRGCGPLPQRLDHVAFWLGQTTPTQTLCGLDASGHAEGLVLRNRTRSKIVKLRLDDYGRAVKDGPLIIGMAKETQR